MKVYSASEAIRPALARTYEYLFRGFKMETFLKLAAMATLCEGLVVSFRFSVHGAFPLDLHTNAWKPLLLTPAFLPVTVLGTIAIFLVGVYCFYLITRLRFAFFHSLVHQTRQIRSSAKLYFVEADHFFTGSMLVWLTFLVVGVLAFLLFIAAAYGAIAAPTPEGKFDRGHFFFLFLPWFAIALALVLSACIAQVVLNDLVLPHMAIEGASFRRAWEDARVRIAANKDTFISYFILRLGMPLVGGLVLGFAAWVAGLIVFGILGMSAAGFTAMLDGTAGLREYVLIAVRLIFILLGLAAALAIAVSFGGPLSVFMRSYALFFYGGHFKALGNLLEPPPPPATTLESERQTL
jgi:hypothetical protein